MNVRKVIAIARHEYTVNIRRPGFIIFTLLVPVMGLLVMALILLSGSALADYLETLFVFSRQPIAVVDASGYFRPILPEFADEFVLYPNQESARAAVDTGQARAAFFIPADYLQKGRVWVYSSGSGFSVAALGDSERVQAFFIAHLVRAYVPPEVLTRLTQGAVRFVPVMEQARGTGPAAFAFTFVVPFIFASLLIVSVFMSSGYLVYGVAEEKENRLVELILSSVSAQEWFLGKVLGLAAVGLTQIAVWVLSGLALSGGSVVLLALAIPALPLSRWLLALVYYLLGYLLYAALYAGLGALGTNARESQQVAGVISFLAAVPFMFTGVLFSNPNSAILRALSHFPLTAPGMMLLRLPLVEVPRVDIIVSLVNLGITLPLAIWLGAKLFRTGILMYGKRPSLPEIWRALRSA